MYWFSNFERCLASHLKQHSAAAHGSFLELHVELFRGQGDGNLGPN